MVIVHMITKKSSGFLEKGVFDWESINAEGKGSTEFILDSVSQLNLIPMRELRNQGVNIENLPQINLNVLTGVGGKMSAK